MSKILKKDFYKSFLLTANEIRTYIKIYERQDKDTMVKFTRSACLYRIFNYYEFTSIIFDSVIENAGTYIAGGYPHKLKYCADLGLLTVEEKNILSVICNSRNRLVHNMEMKMEERERLENKVLEYFKVNDTNSWFITLIQNLNKSQQTTRLDLS